MTRCIALLGGSFDPVHNGHVALGAHFAALLQADELRVIPALPWQKSSLVATPDERVAMLQLAFAGLPCKVTVDRQELERGKSTYTIETLRAIRAEVGPDVSLAFLMGADQLQRLNTWHDWQSLFGLAHFCVAARPGFELDAAHIPPAVALEFQRRLAGPAELHAQPSGLTYVAADMAVDVSATGIRAALQRGLEADSLVPGVVLDYIEQHNLYKN
ncbi:nicotinate-nucleotide adenylyltransferase [Pseudoduganella sp. UC29_106]|uniref:nicotinate-nucleotide adenylyltransferase n=1 Tax=Pseudoduganella sp. UC29_106 TaxID=3374553 RepID=UPI003757AC04